jgi:gliding motility-associated-like protein
VESVVTTEQLESIVGITGVNPDNEEFYQEYIDMNPDLFSNPATVEEVQEMIDIVNGALDNDGDGIPNDEDDDDDNDGIVDSDDEDPFDAFDPNADDDNDGVANGDEDSDGDGNPYNDDCDEDGIPNFMDEDDCGEVGSISTVVSAEIFTPNGDGINDAWVIQGLENYPNNVVKVYNRSGNEVFSANGYQNDWEGFFKDNSKKLPAGSYYYVISLGDNTAPMKGWLFINY